MKAAWVWKGDVKEVCFKVRSKTIKKGKGKQERNIQPGVAEEKRGLAKMEF